MAATSTFIWGEVLPDKPRSISRFYRFPETRLPWLTGQLPLLLLRPRTWTTATPGGSKELRCSAILRRGGTDRRDTFHGLLLAETRRWLHLRGAAVLRWLKKKRNVFLKGRTRSLVSGFTGLYLFLTDQNK